MATAAAKANKGGEIPADKADPEKVHPPYTSAKAHLDQLRQQYRDLENERRETETKIQHERDVDPTDAAAEQVAAGGEVPVHMNERRIATLREHLGAIDQKRRVLAKAIELQESKVSRELHTAAVKVGENLNGIWQAKVDRLADAMIELASAQQDVFDFRDELEERFGISWTLAFQRRPTNVKIGNPRDPASWIATWLSSQVKEGVISASKVPKKWWAFWDRNNPGLISNW